MEGLRLGVRKGAWTAEEDSLLRKCIEQYGDKTWHQVPLRSGLNRCRKSCRLRWLNYLKPDIKRGQCTADEVDLIIRLHKLLGNRWSLIAGRLPGRTANYVKNYWNTHLRKKTIVVDKKAQAKDEKTDKITVIKPRPRTFTKTLPSASMPRDKSIGSTSNIIPLRVEEDLYRPTITSSAGDNNNNNNNPSKSVMDHQENENEWWQNLLADDEKEMLGDFSMEDPIAKLLNEKSPLLTEVGDTSVDAYQKGFRDHDTLLPLDVDNLWDFLDQY